MARPFQFKDEGVSGKTPDKVKAKKLSKGKLKDMPATPGVFSPYNLRINIAFYKEDDLDTPLVELDEPAELRIGFTEDDLTHADGKGSVLQLAYWKGKKWNLLEYDVGAATFPDYVGDLVVQITAWGDPPIAMGP